MSEAIAGIESIASPEPRLAASIVLYRQTAKSSELFFVKREVTLGFAGGFWVFPGGKVEVGESVVTAAARELFEETGVLLATPPTRASLDTLRARLLQEQMSFDEVLSTLQVKFAPERCAPAARWVTPDYLPQRFDTQFFVVKVLEHETPSVWPGELAHGHWIPPALALEAWARGEMLLHPPTLHAVQCFADAEEIAPRLQALKNPPFVSDNVCEKIEFQKGILTFPLKTLTLPPATHTNSYVLGHRDVLLVDVGTDDDTELKRFTLFLERAHLTPQAIVLTHHHSDHVSGAQKLSQQLKVPLWATAQTGALTGLALGRVLREGDVLNAGDMRWHVFGTPGHASGHLILVDEATRSAVVGDMVAGVGTIVIESPDGNMGEYMRQLQRMKELHLRALFPSHGPAIPGAEAKLEEYLRHRRARETKVLQALAGGRAAPLERIVEQAYADLPNVVWPLAERNTQAILEKLVEDKRVAQHETLFQLVST
jgi:endoribonuclease LACTB2